MSTVISKRTDAFMMTAERFLQRQRAKLRPQFAAGCSANMSRCSSPWCVWPCSPTACSRSSFSYQRAQDLADPHPARAGGSGGGQDRPVHPGDREPGRLDHAAALVGGHAGAAALRRPAAAAPGAGDHRARRSSMPPATSSCACRGSPWTWSAARPTSPRTRNSPRPSPTRSITARSISAANPSPT